MHDPATSLYVGVPGYIYVWILALTSVGLFINSTAGYIQVLGAARPEMR